MMAVNTNPDVPCTLNTLPSELRRLIVSHLVPPPDQLRPGCKQHLQNANLAHSCLREWVTEYMFKVMPLKHVLVGMSSQLELFAVTPSNARLLKYVKHVVVQVPTALRWEIGSDGAFGHYLEEITTQRLCKKFRVAKPTALSDEARRYCSDYHRAMVEPFTDNRSWYRLLQAADASWGRVFRSFHNLEEISVGCCEIVDQPPPTYTHTFLLRHGKSVIAELYPLFVKDSTVNVAWASSIVLRTAPPTVQSLQLSMANIDNFNSFATVNRLLSLSYRVPVRRLLHMTTRLSLTVRGIAGAHGNRDWHGDTGSAGAARHWTMMLNSLQGLQNLELYNGLRTDGQLHFSDEDLSSSVECILDWILPDLVLNKLRTLRLSKFHLNQSTMRKTLRGQFPCLQHLELNDIILLMMSNDIDSDVDLVRHECGQSWLNICRAVLEDHPGLQIAVNRPVSNSNALGIDCYLNPVYVEKISQLPGLHVDVKDTLFYLWTSKGNRRLCAQLADGAGPSSAAVPPLQFEPV